MTLTDIIYQRHLRVFDHAAKTGNVAETCRVFGSSRKTFYESKNLGQHRPRCSTSLAFTRLASKRSARPASPVRASTASSPASTNCSSPSSTAGTRRAPGSAGVPGRAGAHGSAGAGSRLVRHLGPVGDRGLPPRAGPPVRRRCPPHPHLGLEAVADGNRAPVGPDAL